MANETNSTANPDPTDDTKTKVLKRFRASRKYTEGGFWDTWRDCWKLYNNRRVSIGYDGISDVFIPETYTIIQGIKAHLINGNLEIEFLPTHPDQKGDVSVLQDLFNYAWMRDMMDQKIDATISEYLITGNCYIFTYVGDDGMPCSRVVSAKDAFFDPQATNYENLGYAGYRYLTTIDDLKDEEVVDPDYDPSNADSSPKKARYQNLDKIGEYKDEGEDKTAKQEREEMMAGTTLDDTKGVVECLVYYDDDKLVTLANREVIIEEVDTPFQRAAKTIQSVDDSGQPQSFEMPEIEPFIPVAPFRNLVDPNLWYARGDVEVIGESQERLNDVQSQKSDNLTYQLNRMWALDPNFAQKIDEIQSVPGAVFTIPPGALEQIITQPIGADADIEIARIKSEMEAATGANELMAGTLSQGGRKSAYMINQELVMLGAKFKVKIAALENEGFRILAQNMWKIMQIYIDKEIPIRVGAPDSATWGNYNPGLYLGDWDVKIKLGASAEAIKETARQQAMQFYLLASKLPFIDQQAAFVTVATQMFDMTKRGAQALISPPQPQQQPTIVPKLIESIDFSQLYPDEQGELLAEAGVQPSPMRQEAAGQVAPPADPQKAALNAKIIHNPNPTGNGGGDMTQQLPETATAPPIAVGAANVPGSPNVR